MLHHVLTFETNTDPLQAFLGIFKAFYKIQKEIMINLDLSEMNILGNNIWEK